MAAARRTPILLIVLVPLLAVGVVALLVDRHARSQANAAKATIDAVLDTNAQERLGRQEIHARLGRQPDGKLVKIGRHYAEKYSWSGGLRRYFVYVTYSPTKKPVLTGVTLNERPR